MNMSISPLPGCSYDEELDPEKLEDIEISLYGMIHHTPQDTFNKETVESSPASPLLPQPSTSSVQYVEPLPASKFVVEKLTVIRNHSTPKPTSRPSSRITDCEDSKYEDINKNFQKKTQPQVSRLEEQNLSSDEDCVIILDKQPEKKDHRTWSDSSSSSLDSDSELEILDHPVSRMKLNVSGCSTSDEIERVLNGLETHRNWRKFVCSKWTEDMVDFYDRQKPMEDLELLQSSLPSQTRFWRLDDADVSGVSRKKNRYFDRNGHNQRCANCQQRDHLTRHCPDPPKQISCHYCGVRGHSHYRCPTKICLGCGRSNQVYVECCHHCRREQTAVCMICKLNHTTRTCPDLWRRYYLTTSDGQELVAGEPALKPANTLFCCNCARRGHLWYDCGRVQTTKYPVAKLNIFSYEDSKEFLDRVTDGGTSSISVSEDCNGNKSVWVLGSPSPKKTRVLSYSFDPAGKISDIRMALAKSKVLAEVVNVEISWRKQKKKGRFIVEFQGKGDKHEARKQFKKLVHVRSNQIADLSIAKKSNNTSNTSALADSSTPKKSFEKPETTDSISTSSAAKKNCGIEAVVIKYTNTENKDVHCLNRLKLNIRQKRHIGTLLAQCQARYRVVITSAIVGTKWEIYIASRGFNDTGNHSTQAFLHIKRYLQSLRHQI